MEAEEPQARNSNLLPVKAKEEVRLRSVLSLNRSASWRAPKSNVRLRSGVYLPPATMVSRILVRVSPKNTDMMEGGASLAPRRWSLPWEAMPMRMTSAWRKKASTTVATTAKKR